MRIAALLALALPVLSGCGFGSSGGGFTGSVAEFSPSDMGVSASPLVVRNGRVPRGGGRYMVGEPYRVAGNMFFPRDDRGYDETGIASWYGPNFHGRRTANGEIFDANFLSGAHPTLPLPSYVRVTNLSNNRSVILRINDRGPFSGGRIVDVSSAAADVLGMKGPGTAQVRVQYVGQAPLEGDDSRYLSASIQGPPLPQGGGNVQVASSGGSSSLVGAIIGLFSYADSGADPLAVEGDLLDAHQAVDAMAASTPDLAAWAASIDAESRAIQLPLGVFEDPARAATVAEAFAFYGAVAEDSINVSGVTATRLTLTHLKPGVVPADLHSVAGALGLADLVLYE